MYRIYKKDRKQWSMKDSGSWSMTPIIGWRTLGHLKQHLHVLYGVSYSKDKLESYRSDDCYLIEYKEVEINRYKMKDVLNKFKDKKEKEILERKQIYIKNEKEERYKEYLELKKEFEN